MPGSSPGEGNNNPFQYSRLENSMVRGAWWSAVHGAAESDTTEHTHNRCLISSVFTHQTSKNAMNYIWITVEIRRTLSLKDIYIYLQSPNSRTCTLPTVIWSKDISPRVSFLHNKCHLIAPAPSHPVTHWSQNPLTSSSAFATPKLVSSLSQLLSNLLLLSS